MRTDQREGARLLFPVQGCRPRQRDCMNGTEHYLQ